MTSDSLGQGAVTLAALCAALGIQSSARGAAIVHCAGEPVRYERT
jgi:hypothetical protein